MEFNGLAKRGSQLAGWVQPMGPDKPRLSAHLERELVLEGVGRRCASVLRVMEVPSVYSSDLRLVSASA